MDRTLCPRCARIGFVRTEYVIQGKSVTRSYYCGRCTHTWHIEASASQDVAGPPSSRPRRGSSTPKARR